jgi:hypothetical protein
MFGPQDFKGGANEDATSGLAGGSVGEPRVTAEPRRRDPGRGKQMLGTSLARTPNRVEPGLAMVRGWPETGRGTSADYLSRLRSNTSRALSK